VGEIELVNTSEDRKDDNPPFNVRKYRYTVSVASIPPCY